MGNCLADDINAIWFMDSYYTQTMLKTIGCLLKFFYRLDYIDNFANSERVTLGDYHFNDLICTDTLAHIGQETASKWFLTWTRDSGSFILHATSSRINISGYRVLPNKSSKTSNCPRVKVVRSLRCFLVLTPANEFQGRKKTKFAN